MRRSGFSEEQIICCPAGDCAAICRAGRALQEHRAELSAAELGRTHGIRRPAGVCLQTTKGSDATFYIYECLSRCKIFADLIRRQVPGCKHLSGVTGRWCAQMGIPRGEPQQMVDLAGPL